jgi:hypothetical protein
MRKREADPGERVKLAIVIDVPLATLVQHVEHASTGIELRFTGWDADRNRPRTVWVTDRLTAQICPAMVYSVSETFDMGRPLPWLGQDTERMRQLQAEMEKLQAVRREFLRLAEAETLIDAAAKR